MAGALSGHILGSFSNSPNMNLVTSGPMSFNASMHDSQIFSAPFTPYSHGTQNSFILEEMSEATAKKVAALQVKLNQKLGPEYISQRPGPGGGQKLTYAEGWKIINLANEVFGFNGWSSSLVSITTDFVDFDETSKRYSVGVTAIVRVTLRDGVYHEDVGYGILENSKSKGMALDKCKKEAVTDGLKRALRNFGNLLGNCLYDKAYTQEVVKMKVAPPKFDASKLHRRPECEVKPNISSSSNSNNAPNVDRNAPTPQKTPATHPPHKQTDVNPRASTSSNVSRTTPAQPQPQPQQNISTNHTVSHNYRSRDPICDTKPQQQQDSHPLQRKVTFNTSTNSDVTRNILEPNRTAECSPGIPAISPLRMGRADSEDEFFGCSEDDAFFASVELGDADLGRPIGDEDDGGLRNASDVSNATSGTNHVVPPSHRNQVSSAHPKPSTASGLLSGLLPQNQKRLQGANYPVVDNENIPPAKDIVRPSLTTGSVGGFHFPPGVNPFQQQQDSRLAGQLYQNFSTKVGTKRTAEAGSTSDKYQLGMKRGMGLQQGGREILGPLEIGEGGDVKRTRR